MTCDWCDRAAQYVIVEPDGGGCKGWRSLACIRCALRWLKTFPSGTRLEAA